METLFSRHKPRKKMVVVMLAGSLVLHGGLVGIATLYTPPQPPPHTVPFDPFPVYEGPIEVDTKTLPPSSPSEIPEATATPEVVDVTPTPPPAPDIDEFADAATPTPPVHRPVMTRPPSSTNRPPSNTQPAPRNPGIGVPGNGTSASAVGAWDMPHPPYPHTANRATGQTTVRVTTDATGRVSNVVIVQSTGNPILDNHTLSYVRNNWHGPANASRTTQFVYELK